MCVGNSGRCTNHLYYMQYPKRGLVASGGHVLRYRDYLVSGEWLMNLLQQRKLAFACARAELIKVGKNVPRLLQNLGKWEHEEEQAALQGHIGEVSSKFSLLKRPFRKVLAFDAWLAQYKHDTFRYRFWCWKARAVWGKLSSA